MTNPHSCPKCSGRLEESEQRDLPVDKCVSCQGLWVDYTALDALLESRLPGRHIGDSSSLMNPLESDSTTMTCPRCRSSLLRYKREDIAVEWCRDCRGLFLDHTEIDRLVAWRKENRAEARKVVAAGMAREGAREVADLALTVLIADALYSLFEGVFSGSGKS